VRKLARKHGGTLQAALARRDSMSAELLSIDDHGGELLRREAEVHKRAQAALQLARALSQKRKSAAAAFAKAVAGELAMLGMAKSELSVRFLAIAEGGISLPGDAGPQVLGPRGLETAELMLSPNLGEEQKPLARIASGGELSRVLLAVKRVLVESDPVGAYLFDEVDAGIGGVVADAVGRALAAVARDRQIICITHLPQIAAFARRHQTVEKEVARGRTRTRVTAVEGDERAQELARLLSGHVTDASLLHARELLDKAQEPSTKRSRRAS